MQKLKHAGRLLPSAPSSTYASEGNVVREDALFNDASEAPNSYDADEEFAHATYGFGGLDTP